MRQFFARFKYITATLLFVLTTSLSSGGAVFADPGNGNNPPGNNGTIKIHEQGTASGTESNDPKVCVFNVEAFSFDSAQSGYLNFAVQGGDGPTGVAAGPYAFGPTDVNGYYASQYFNLSPGHYKATLYGKDSVGQINLQDEKAKSKVFKVECPATSVTPATVTFNDVCGTANDTYTIPTTVGVDYKVANVIKTAGTYAGAGSVTVTAAAQANYALTGTTSWSNTFTNVPCTTTVTPNGVTFVDLCGTSNDKYTIPTTVGVNYQINGQTVAAGNYSGTGTITITAVAQANYTLTGTATWSHTFATTPCDVPVTPGTVTYTDSCGTANDTYTIPNTTGVTYLDAQNNVLSAGVHSYSGGNSFAVHPVAQTGYVLSGTTTWTLAFTNVPCVVTVTPQPPTASTPNCEVQTMIVSLPSAQAGVIWSPSVSTTLQPNGGTVTYTASAAQNYQFPVGAQTTWTFTNNFNPASCNCGCHEDQDVTAPVPSFQDVCGTDHDKYVIPAETGVYYKVNGVTKSAGTYDASGTVSIEAYALPGYHLEGTHSWSHEFTNVPCIVKVHAPRVEFKDLCDTKNDTFTIPSKTGVEYWVNGHVLASGTYYANDYEVNGTVTVTAVAKAGYVLKGHVHSWTMHFTNEECGGGGGEQNTPATPGAATFSDVCATANDTYTIPTTAGVTYKVNGVVTAAGTYPATGTITVTAEAQAGFVLSGIASWTHTFTNESCGQVLGESTVIFTPTAGKGAAVQAAQLANTGQNSLTSAIIAFVIATSAVLVYAFAPKRQLS